MKRKSTSAAVYLALIAAVFTTLAGLYLSIAPQEITRANFGGDGGDFVAAALTFGVPHPTGYPAYTLMGVVLQRLPPETDKPYARAVLLSLLPAALGAAFLAGLLAAVLMTPGGKQERQYGWSNLAAGAAAGLAWGVSPLLWAQAVIVEVHGLQSLFVLAVLGWTALLLAGAADKRVGWVCVGLSWLVGLGMGNHVTLALALPVVGIGAWQARQRGMGRGWLLAQAGAFLLGLSVYVYLPLAARANPPVNWGDPHTWEGFIWLVGGKAYQNLLFSGGLPLFAQRLSAWGGLLVKQFGVLGVFLGAYGAVQGGILPRGMNAALGWVFGVYSLFAMAYNTVDSTAYLLPAFLVFAVWIGVGLMSACAWSWPGELHNWKVRPGWIVIAIFATLVLVRIPETRAEVDPRKDVQTAAFTERVFEILPEGALYFARSEADTFPLWYDHFGRGRRPDLRIISYPLAQFTWYQENVLKTYPDLIPPGWSDNASLSADAWVATLVAVNPGRSLCWGSVPQADGSLKEPACSPNR